MGRAGEIATTLFVGVITLAIVAVLVSKQAGTKDVITGIGGALAGVIKTAVGG